MRWIHATVIPPVLAEQVADSEQAVAHSKLVEASHEIRAHSATQPSPCRSCLPGADDDLMRAGS
jgi:hypothetical protein